MKAAVSRASLSKPVQGHAMRLRLISLIPVSLVLSVLLCRNLFPEREPLARNLLRHTYGWPSSVLSTRLTVLDHGFSEEQLEGSVNWNGLTANTALVVGLALAAALATSWFVCRRERRRQKQSLPPATVRFPFVGLAAALLTFAGLIAANCCWEFVRTNDQFSPLHTYGWPFVAVEEQCCMALVYVRTWQHWGFAGDILVALAVPLLVGALCEVLFHWVSRIGARKAEHKDTSRTSVRAAANFSLGTLIVTTLVAGLILWANLKPGYLLFQPERRMKTNGRIYLDGSHRQRQFGWPYWAMVQPTTRYYDADLKDPYSMHKWYPPDPSDWHRDSVIKNAVVGFFLTLAAALLSEVLIRFNVFGRIMRLRRGTLFAGLAILVAFIVANVVPEKTMDVSDAEANYALCHDRYGWPFRSFTVRRNGSLTSLHWTSSNWHLRSLASNLAVATGLVAAVGLVCEFAARRRTQSIRATSESVIG
jgi:hypothetical protein